MLSVRFAVLACLATQVVVAQQIWDVYTTTSDRKSLFKYENLKTPISFAKKAESSSATITISDSTTYQTINGFGATLTDTSSSALSQLKKADDGKYWTLINQLFNPSPTEHNAGLSYVRVSLAASDLSSEHYSYNDVEDDEEMKHFTLNKAANTIQVLKDIASVNKRVQVHLVPWSPPAWMKSNNNMRGGTIPSKHYTAFATYLYRAVSEFDSATGVRPFAIAIQNEPQNADGTYPTCSMSVDAMGSIANQLRSMLNNNGFSETKVIGYEHNWDDAAAYPTKLMSKYGKALSGVAFHCYKGNYKQQQAFTNQHPDKEVYFTECTGMIGTDWWSDIKWFMDNIFIGTLEYGARSALLWNIAADKKGGPTFPGTDSCRPGGCRPIVTITGNSYTLNQEYYALAQAQRAVLPKDADGPRGKRVKVSVSGGMEWALRVGAYVTGRSDDKEWHRYSLVVLNWADGNKAVKTNIAFRGMTATYKFPVGVTTLYWYASANGRARRFEDGTIDDTVVVSHEGTELPSTTFAEADKELTSEANIVDKRALAMHHSHSRSTHRH